MCVRLAQTAEPARGFHALFKCCEATVCAAAAAAAVDDVPVEKIAVWKRPPEGVGHAWEGMTLKKAPTFLIRRDTPLIKALSHACYVIAGEVAEAVLDPHEYRAGTALDEVLFSQRIAGALADRAKMEAEKLWEEIRKRSWQIIVHNKSAARELISRLDRTETLQRKALTNVLDKIGYVAGVSDAVNFCRQFTGRGPNTSCTPPEVTSSQEADVVRSSWRCRGHFQADRAAGTHTQHARLIETEIRRVESN